MLFTVAVLGSGTAVFAQTGAGSAPEPSGGPIRLRQPQQVPQPQEVDSTGRDANERRDPNERRDANERPGAAERPSTAGRLPRYRPGEFELYIQGITADFNLRRFGADLVIDTPTGRAATEDAGPHQVPPDYRVAPGDELLVMMWGSEKKSQGQIIVRTG